MISIIAPPITTNARLSRKALAKQTGVRESTIKFYSELGLLPYRQAGEGLARRYDLGEAMARLREIQALKAQGLSIHDIRGRFAE